MYEKHTSNVKTHKIRINRKNTQAREIYCLMDPINKNLKHTFNEGKSVDKPLNKEVS